VTNRFVVTNRNLKSARVAPCRVEIVVVVVMSRQRV